MSDNQYGSYPPPSEQPAPSDLPTPTQSWSGLTDQPAEGRAQAKANLKKNHRVAIVATVLILVGMAVGGYFLLRSTGINGTATPAAAGSSSTTKAPTKLEAAPNKCYLPGTDPTDLGHTLTLRNVAAKENAGPVSMDDMQCVFRELDVPQAVLDHIGQTRAMDGIQNDSWEGMSVRWNYHPDSGVNITFTEAK